LKPSHVTHAAWGGREKRPADDAAPIAARGR
jgi:hypothetical protein